MQHRGLIRIVDPELPRALESDTITCSHCQRVVALHERDGRRKDGVTVHCHCCNCLTCVPCAETGRCEPFERKLEVLEARARLRAAVEAG